MTTGTALADAARRLRAAGIDSPETDAALLLAHLLGADRTYLRGHPGQPLTAAEVRRYDDLVRRREQREPLPYLLGSWPFLDMRLEVTPAVLIPRPETEVLVEALADRLRHSPPAPEAPARLLDVGTGSGCIALALARLFPESCVVALDLSPAALAVARRNAAAAGVAERIDFVEGAFPGVATGTGPFAAVAANPPYIPTAELGGLQPEVGRFEPRLALDGGPDGLVLLRSLVEQCPTLLAPGGWLAVEVAAGQAPRVEQLVREGEEWEAVENVADLAGIPRVVMARRR